MPLTTRKLGKLGFQYAKSTLDGANLLAQRVAQRLKPDATQAFVVVPENASSDLYLRLEAGGKVEASDAELWLSSYVVRFLNSPDSFFIVEDPLAHPGDLHLERAPTAFLSYQQRIFYYAVGEKHSTNEVVRLLRFANRYPFVGFLGDDFRGSWAATGETSMSDLDQIAELVRVVCLGVYDEESYLICEL